MSDEKQHKIEKVFCPFSKEACDRRCPAWTRMVYTTENITVVDENTGFCTKLQRFDEEGRLVV